MVEARLPKFVHERAHTRPRSADNLSERLLAEFSLKRILAANESQLCALSAMERRGINANEHWTVKAVFAFGADLLSGRGDRALFGSVARAS